MIKLIIKRHDQLPKLIWNPFQSGKSVSLQKKKGIAETSFNCLYNIFEYVIFLLINGFIIDAYTSEQITVFKAIKSNGRIRRDFWITQTHLSLKELF